MVEPSVGLLSRLSPVPLSQHNSYLPLHSQVLTPPMKRIVQRRSLKPVSPIDHFRHDTKQYAHLHWRFPTPTVGDDAHEAVSDVRPQSIFGDPAAIMSDVPWTPSNTLLRHTLLDMAVVANSI